MKASAPTNILFLSVARIDKTPLISFFTGRTQQTALPAVKSAVGYWLMNSDFESYNPKSAEGMELCIYDFQGVNSGSFNSVSEKAIGFINEKYQSRHIADWVHSVFLFVDVNEGRFSSQQADFIKKLKKSFSSAYILCWRTVE